MEFSYKKEESYFLKFKTSLGLIIYYRYYHGLHFVYDTELHTVSRNETLEDLFNCGCVEIQMTKDEYLSVLSKIDRCHYDEPGVRGPHPKANYVYNEHSGYFIVYNKSKYVRVTDTLFSTTGSAKMFLQFNFTEKESRKFCLISYNEYAKLMNELDE